MKTKTKLLKIHSAIIIAIIGMLGFTSCEKEKCKCPSNCGKSKCECSTDIRPMYGPPTSCFIFNESDEIVPAEKIEETHPISNDDNN